METNALQTKIPVTHIQPLKTICLVVSEMTLPMEFKVNGVCLVGVDCPYEYVRILRKVDGYFTLNLEYLRKMVVFSGKVPCLGICCSIYPCERVVRFAEEE